MSPLMTFLLSCLLGPGHVYAGYHEVILTQAAADRAKVAVESGRPPWRVSSTLFSHINSDQTLEPLGWFANGSPDGKGMSRLSMSIHHQSHSSSLESHFCRSSFRLSLHR